MVCLYLRTSRDGLFSLSCIYIGGSKRDDNNSIDIGSVALFGV